MISNNIETITPKWSWNPASSETQILKDNLTIIDSGQGKAWTTAIGPDISINKQANTFYYYEVKIEFCNTSNSIKIVIGLMSKRYMDKILSITRGEIGSLKGSSPFGYFKEFGIGTLCYLANGTISQDGFSFQKAQPYTTNDRVGMLIDTANSSVAFVKNGQLQTSFISILNSFQSAPNIQSPKTSFSIYPSISLIKQNSVSIINDPPIPTFIYDSNSKCLLNSNSNDISSATIVETNNLSISNNVNNSVNKSSDINVQNNNNNNNNSNNINNNNNNSNNINNNNNNSNNNSNNNNSNNNSSISSINNSTSPKKEVSSTTATATTTTITTTTTTIPNVQNNSNGNKPTTTTTTATATVTIAPSPSININKDLPDPNNNCPVCGISFKSIGKDWACINKHIDECLTFNLLDKETDDPKRPESVKCPYCRKSVPTVEFIYHCNDKHLLGDQHNHRCPLCNEKAINLISHLSKSHVRVPQKQVGVGYSISTLEQDLGEQECPICLEEFYQGQQVARLECWCIFHQNCISTYIAKSKKCPVHN